MSQEATAEFVVNNQLGLHVRAAAMVVRTVRPYQSKVTIRTDGGMADASSVLDLLTLSASKVTTIEIRAEGPDAEAVVAALGNLISRNFAE